MRLALAKAAYWIGFWSKYRKIRRDLRRINRPRRFF